MLFNYCWKPDCSSFFSVLWNKPTKNPGVMELFSLCSCRLCHPPGHHGIGRGQQLAGDSSLSGEHRGPHWVQTHHRGDGPPAGEALSHRLWSGQDQLHPGAGTEPTHTASPAGFVRENMHSGKHLLKYLHSAPSSPCFSLSFYKLNHWISHSPGVLWSLLFISFS